MHKTKLSTSSVIAEAVKEMSELREHADTLQKRLERLESEMVAVKKAMLEVSQQIESVKSLVEKNVLDFSGREISITV